MDRKPQVDPRRIKVIACATVIEEMVARMGLLNDAMRAGGMEYPQPLGPIFAMALPVIPDYGFTDVGLVDVARQERVPLWA